MENILPRPKMKRTYVSPEIDTVQLDNEISLIMNSAASSPEGDPESM